MKIDGYEVHPSITAERIMLACESRYGSLNDPGFCVACGAEADGVEPDAQTYECESCGAPTVFGADELLFHIGAAC